MSLNILSEIVNHLSISRFMRKITISSERIGYSDDGHILDTRMMGPLRTSMVQSELDYSVLTNALRRFPALSTVRFDYESYSMGALQGNAAARCGIRSIKIEKGLVWQQDEQYFKHTIDAVFTSLYSSGLATKVDIDINASILGHASPGISNDFFHSSSPSYTTYITRMKSLTLFDWARSALGIHLLHSDPNLHFLSIIDQRGIYSHPHPHLLSPPTWPSLCTLNLHGPSCLVQDLSKILATAQHTLPELDLKFIELLDDSSEAPFPHHRRHAASPTPQHNIPLRNHTSHNLHRPLVRHPDATPARWLRARL